MKYVRRKKYERQRVSLGNFPPSKTIQSETDNTNINNIVQRFRRTGIIPPDDRTPQFADVSTLMRMDLTELISLQRKTQAEFDTFMREREEANETNSERTVPPVATPGTEETHGGTTGTAEDSTDT